MVAFGGIKKYRVYASMSDQSGDIVKFGAPSWWGKEKEVFIVHEAHISQFYVDQMEHKSEAYTAIASA